MQYPFSCVAHLDLLLDNAHFCIALHRILCNNNYQYGLLVTRVFIKRGHIMNIKDLRLQKRMTQKELADAIGVNTSIISKYETGAVTPPVKRLQAIAHVLEIEPNILLEIEHQEKYSMDPLERLAHYTLSIQQTYLNRMVLLGANGCCELCEKEAPFIDKQGRPFLIIHPIDKNYDKDTPEKNLVALCPNCLAKAIILNNDSDMLKLRKKAEHHIY